MATQQQFTKITPQQWASIDNAFKTQLIGAFDPSIASALNYETVRLMSLNVPFKQYLQSQVNIAPNSIVASGSGATYTDPTTKKAYIGTYFLEANQAPAVTIQGITHELGHSTTLNGLADFDSGSNPDAYARARAFSEGRAKYAEYEVNSAFPAGTSAATGVGWQELFATMATQNTPNGKIAAAATWTQSQEPSTEQGVGATYLTQNRRDYVFFKLTNQYDSALVKLVRPDQVQVLVNPNDPQIWSATITVPPAASGKSARIERLESGEIRATVFAANGDVLNATVFPAGSFLQLPAAGSPPGSYPLTLPGFPAPLGMVEVGADGTRVFQSLNLDGDSYRKVTTYPADEGGLVKSVEETPTGKIVSFAAEQNIVFKTIDDGAARSSEYYDASGEIVQRVAVEGSRSTTTTFESGAISSTVVVDELSWGTEVREYGPTGSIKEVRQVSRDESGNSLVLSTLADGSGTAKSFDSDGNLISEAVLTKVDELSGRYSLELAVGRVPVSFEAVLSNGVLTLIGFRSIDHQEPGFADLLNASLHDVNINAKDLLLAGNGIGVVSQLADAGNTGQPGGWTPKDPSGDAPWYGEAIVQQLGGSLTSIQSLIAGIQSGKPLPIASSLFSLAAHLSRHQLFNTDGTPALDKNGYAQFDGGDATLGNIATGFSAINSLIGLRTALNKGDPLGALSSGLALSNTVLSTYQSVLAGQISAQFGSVAAARIAIDQGDELAVQVIGEFDAVGSAIGQVSNILPWVNLFVALKNGDALSAIGAAAALWGYPVVGWVIAVYQILDALFHDYDIEGTVEFRSVGDGRHVDAHLTNDSDGGGATVMSVTSAILENLNKALDDMPDQGLVASRLPRISFVGYDGGGGEFTLTWTDAKTGKTVTRTFDSNSELLALMILSRTAN